MDNNVINPEQIIWDSEKLYKYYEVIELFGINRSTATNRKRTINNKIRKYFIVEEVKTSKGTYYMLVARLPEPNSINQGRPIKYKEEKEYLLYSMMANIINKRVGIDKNRIQKGLTSICIEFGLLKKPLDINRISKYDVNYDFLYKNRHLLKKLNKWMEGKCNTIKDYISKSDYIILSKSYILIQQDARFGEEPEIRNLNEQYNIDILDFNYNEFINYYKKKRHGDRIIELIEAGKPETVINDERNKELTEFMIYNIKEENDLLQKELRRYFKERYTIEPPTNYNFVCIYNLTIDENNDKYNLLNNKILPIDKDLVNKYRKVLNDDIVKHLKDKALKDCNNNRNLSKFKKYMKLIEICIKI